MRFFLSFFILTIMRENEAEHSSLVVSQAFVRFDVNYTSECGKFERTREHFVSSSFSIENFLRNRSRRFSSFILSSISLIFRGERERKRERTKKKKEKSFRWKIGENNFTMKLKLSCYVLPESSFSLRVILEPVDR